MNHHRGAHRQRSVLALPAVGALTAGGHFDQSPVPGKIIPYARQGVDPGAYAPPKRRSSLLCQREPDQSAAAAGFLVA